MQLLRDNLTLWTSDVQGDGKRYYTYDQYDAEGLTEGSELKIQYYLTRPDTRLPQSRAGGQGP